MLDITEEDLRIRSLLTGVDEKDMQKVYEKWAEYLEKSLQFPFEAEICEYQERGRGEIQEGDKVTVSFITGIDDMYGILVRIGKKKKQYIFPLCDLEVIDKKTENYLPVNDYSYWFANY